jgi:hypothetical protein
MRPDLTFGLVTAAALCWLGMRRHRPQRAGVLGGFRCETCGRAFADLDDAGEPGAGYVSPLRPIYSRDGAGGHATVSREEVG